MLTTVVKDVSMKAAWTKAKEIRGLVKYLDSVEIVKDKDMLKLLSFQCEPPTCKFDCYSWHRLTWYSLSSYP